MVKRIAFNDCQMFVDDSLDVHRMIEGNGLNYEVHVRRELERLLPAARTMYDIGANVGIHTVSAKQINPGLRVVCFEMSPHNYSMLVRTVGLNNWPDVHVLPVAVYDRNGILGFNECLDNPICGEHDQAFPRWTPCYRIDFFNLPPPDVIKMDIEGAEIKALEGMGRLMDNRPTILFEHNFECTLRHGFDLNAVPAFLFDRGYRITTIGYTEGVRADFDRDPEAFNRYVRQTTGGMMDCLATPL